VKVPPGADLQIRTCKLVQCIPYYRVLNIDIVKFNEEGCRPVSDILAASTSA
jgi:hypothetical protein